MSKIPSAKRMQISKALNSTVIFVGLAAFCAIFSIVASRALLDQRAYHSRVIKEKTIALNQLRANNVAAQNLVRSYEVFVAEPINSLGGSATGTGDLDGDNARIILDALPSKYDFPALATSIEKLIGPKYKVNSITGNDDEVNQANQTETIPVEMPFEFSVTSNLQLTQELLERLQRSIRPISIVSLTLKGANNDLELSIEAHSYYQPGRTADITKKVVR